MPLNKSGSRALLDFDGDPKKLVQDAFDLGSKAMVSRIAQWGSDYKQFSAFIDMADRNPDGANIFLPKIMSIIRTKVPRDVRANFGSRPYISLKHSPGRDEFEESISVTQDVVDDLLDKGRLYVHGALATILKTTYGTSFIEGTPYYETVKEPVLIPTPFGFEKQYREVQRLRYRLRVYGPWDIVVCPLATGLEEKGQCRFLIKKSIVSKRQVITGWKQGMYPGLDVEKLIKLGQNTAGGTMDDQGLKMLAEQGLISPHWDSDIGVLLRYESEERYIDMFVLGMGGRPEGIVLRNIPNALNHGGINLSRMIHDMDAHTKNMFWGIGEVKPNEVLQALDNDLWNMALDSHNKMNVPIIYHSSAISADALTRSLGGKVKVDIKDGKSVASHVYESFGPGLPRDHYEMIDRTERYMDTQAGQFETQRGEITKGNTTATEISRAEAKGDSRMEFNVRLGEEMFMKDFAEKTIENIVQHQTIDDIVEIVGLERASRAIMLSLIDAPGVMNMEFKGSDRITNLLVKQQAMEKLADFLLKLPNTLPGALGKVMLELNEIDKETIEKILVPDNVMMAVQAMSQQIGMSEEQQTAAQTHEFQMKLQASRGGAGGKAPGSNQPEAVNRRAAQSTTVQPRGALKQVA